MKKPVVATLLLAGLIGVPGIALADTVYFSDPIRLQQDVDEAVQDERPCFAEPGLIVVPEVTVQAIQEAVQFLWKQGFFASLKAEQGKGVESTTPAPNQGLEPTR